MTDAEINSILNRKNVCENVNFFRDDVELSERDNNSSQHSTESSQMEYSIFSRYEFIAAVRSINRLLFVHDNGHFYFFRYRNAKGNVYSCRDRKKCDAKVLIDTNGACIQFGSHSHSNPSVREEYENIVLHNLVRDDCSGDDILRQQNLRCIYNRRKVQ